MVAGSPVWDIRGMSLIPKVDAYAFTLVRLACRSNQRRSVKPLPLVRDAPPDHQV
jgi:hypothetical protein